MIIEKIEMYRLKVPLKRPYKIASAEMKAFDCTIAVLQAQNRQGIGEAMSDVQGYFWETPEEVWQFAREKGKSIMGLTPARAYQEISMFTRKQPCAATPFLTAIEVLSGNPVLTPSSEIQLVPMVGILQAEEKKSIDEEIKTFIAQGYDTIKVKVGFDVDKDIERVRIAQEAIQGKALIRLDANQGYNLPQALKLVRNIDPQRIEFLEQPFKEKEWNAMVELARVSPIPLCLDESIYGIEAVERTQRLNCARFVKFKIMKMGSTNALVEGIETAKRYGLEVILGNGAAGEISCYHEALVSGKMITRAGEMNGFLKQKESILTEGFKIQGGKVVLEPQFSLRLDPLKMDRFAIDSLLLSQ
jgi:L-alanine-DL-glutamate epimerase-like enolase superfamily enzyme